MNLLFWNLRNNSIEHYISDCIHQRNIDIAVFTEISNLDIDKLRKELGNCYYCVESYSTYIRMLAVASKKYSLSAFIEDTRYSIYKVEQEEKLQLILAGVHLEDRRNYPDAEYRIETLRTLLDDIDTKSNKRVAIIGDFNANPHDKELLWFATSFKDVLKNKNERFDFYNPTVHFISEIDKNYGSFYYLDNKYRPVWNCLDQVLVSRTLADCVTKIEYLRKIGNKSLMSKVKPDKNISDHLPLMVTMKL